MIPRSRNGYAPDGTRRLLKGGDGGANEMKMQEAYRQAKIQDAVNAINQQFQAPGRDAMYGDLAGAVKGVAQADLDKQFTTASKQNLFGLARSGLLGGSVDAEAGGDLQQRYGEGQIKAEQAGVGAASDLRSTDERTRQNLISLAQSGVDTGTAASLAATQSGAAADAARANAGSASVGRLFDDLGQTYLQNTALRARYPNGLPQQQGGAAMFGSLFSPKAYTGKVEP